MLLFYTPWKHQKTFRFSDVFRGYRKATPGCNRLIITGLKALFTSSWLESQERVCQIVWNLLVLKFCKNLMIRDLVATLRKSLVSFCLHQIYWPEVSSRGEYILFCNRIVLKKYVWVILSWSSGPVVKAMDFVDPGSKIYGWLQGRISLSSLRGWSNEHQELLGTKWWKGNFYPPSGCLALRQLNSCIKRGHIY